MLTQDAARTCLGWSSDLRTSGAQRPYKTAKLSRFRWTALTHNWDCAWQEELNKAVLTEQYDINRWFRAFGARPKQLFANPLNDVRHTHAGLEYRDSYHNGAGITFHSKLLSSPLLVRNRAHLGAAVCALMLLRTDACRHVLHTVVSQLISTLDGPRQSHGFTGLEPPRWCSTTITRYQPNVRNLWLAGGQ